MGRPVLILGNSGVGKTASLRNFKEDEIFYINVLNKELPFKKKFKYTLYSDDYAVIRAKMLGASNNGIKTMVIDDSGYLITNKFMRNQGNKKGGAVFEFYSQLAYDFWDLINFVKSQLKDDVIVYMIMHEETNDLGEVKPKTIGKLLNEKVCVEGLFTIVLRAIKMDNHYLFRTQSNGLDIAKTPIGMFENEEIENDLQLVTKTIKKYYGGK